MPKALSILQPWAWLIVNGHKPVENRSWYTPFRGTFYVHAGKKWGREQKEDLQWVRETFPHIILPDTFDLGGIVGTARLGSCVNSWPGAVNSPWFFGPFGFVLYDTKPLAFTPMRGQLGFFDVPEGVVPHG